MKALAFLYGEETRLTPLASPEISKSMSECLGNAFQHAKDFAFCVGYYKTRYILKPSEQKVFYEGIESMVTGLETLETQINNL